MNFSCGWCNEWKIFHQILSYPTCYSSLSWNVVSATPTSLYTTWKRPNFHLEQNQVGQDADHSLVLAGGLATAFNFGTEHAAFTWSALVVGRVLPRFPPAQFLLQIQSHAAHVIDSEKYLLTMGVSGIFWTVLVAFLVSFLLCCTDDFSSHSAAGKCQYVDFRWHYDDVNCLVAIGPKHDILDILQTLRL